MNFDGDWIATNNWKNLDKYSIKPVIYYYIAETKTHYFITYGYFHARDWTQLNVFNVAQHENDLEGIMLMIEKDDNYFGSISLGYSVFHLSIKRFAYNLTLELNSSSYNKLKKGSIEAGHHPKSFQQPRGHGIKLENSFHKDNRPFCRYLPENVSQTTNQDTHYELINLLSPGEMIEQRGNDSFFNIDETIKGTHGNGANPPWLWRDHKDKKSHPEVQIFKDPAKYILIDFMKDKSFDTTYIYHPFLLDK